MRAAVIDVRLLDPVAQRLLGHAEITGDLLDRPAALPHQLDRLTTELLGVRGTRAWHGHHILSAGSDRPKRSGVHEQGRCGLDEVRRDESTDPAGHSGTEAGKWIKGTRYSLLKDTAKQTARQLLKLAEVVLTNKRMYRAFLLYGELRYIYRLPKEEAPERLDAWLAWASRSRLKPFVKLARTIRKHKAGVLAAIELNLSNGRLEALNSKVRLISHRAYGFHSADALIAMIYLCCAGIQIPLPHR